MKQRKLNYRFHNPNSAEATADFLCKLFIEVNTDKVERALREAALMNEEKKEYIDNPMMIEDEKKVSLKRRGAR